MLADVTKTDIDTVRVAIKLLQDLEMLEILDDKTIYIESVNKMIGSETEGAERVRKHRQKIKMLQCNKDVTKVLRNKEKDIDTEKEKDIDKNIYTEASSVLNTEKKSIITLPCITNKQHNIYQDDIDNWQEIYIGIDVTYELRKMREWLIANPTRKKTLRGIRKFIINWLGRAQDNPKQKQKTGYVDYKAQQMRIQLNKY